MFSFQFCALFFSLDPFLWLIGRFAALRDEISSDRSEIDRLHDVLWSCDNDDDNTRLSSRWYLTIRSMACCASLSLRFTEPKTGERVCSLMHALHRWWWWCSAGEYVMIFATEMMLLVIVDWRWCWLLLSFQLDRNSMSHRCACLGLQTCSRIYMHANHYHFAYHSHPSLSSIIIDQYIISIPHFFKNWWRWYLTFAACTRCLLLDCCTTPVTMPPPTRSAAHLEEWRDICVQLAGVHLIALSSSFAHVLNDLRSKPSSRTVMWSCACMHCRCCSLGIWLEYPLLDKPFWAASTPTLSMFWKW